MLTTTPLCSLFKPPSLNSSDRTNAVLKAQFCRALFSIWGWVGQRLPDTERSQVQSRLNTHTSTQPKLEPREEPTGASWGRWGLSSCGPSCRNPWGGHSLSSRGCSGLCRPWPCPRSTSYQWETEPVSERETKKRERGYTKRGGGGKKRERGKTIIRVL